MAWPVRGEKPSSKAAQTVLAGLKATPLFEKALTTSDVSAAGRLVIPKKAAEAHFPHVEGRGGLAVRVCDVWGRQHPAKLRYWANNAAGRMYVLEGTQPLLLADYGLEAGDVVTFARLPGCQPAGCCMLLCAAQGTGQVKQRRGKRMADSSSCSNDESCVQQAAAGRLPRKKAAVQQANQKQQQQEEQEWEQLVQPKAPSSMNVAKQQAGGELQQGTGGGQQLQGQLERLLSLRSQVRMAAEREVSRCYSELPYEGVPDGVFRAIPSDWSSSLEANKVYFSLQHNCFISVTDLGGELYEAFHECLPAAEQALEFTMQSTPCPDARWGLAGAVPGALPNKLQSIPATNSQQPLTSLQPPSRAATPGPSLCVLSPSGGSSLQGPVSCTSAAAAAAVAAAAAPSAPSGPAHAKANKGHAEISHSPGRAHHASLSAGPPQLGHGSVGGMAPSPAQPPHHPYHVLASPHLAAAMQDICPGVFSPQLPHLDAAPGFSTPLLPPLPLPPLQESPGAAAIAKWLGEAGGGPFSPEGLQMQAPSPLPSSTWEAVPTAAAAATAALAAVAAFTGTSTSANLQLATEAPSAGVGGLPDVGRWTPAPSHDLPPLLPSFSASLLGGTPPPPSSHMQSGSDTTAPPSPPAALFLLKSLGSPWNTSAQGLLAGGERERLKQEQPWTQQFQQAPAPWSLPGWPIASSTIIPTAAAGMQPLWSSGRGQQLGHSTAEIAGTWARGAGAGPGLERWLPLAGGAALATPPIKEEPQAGS